MSFVHLHNHTEYSLLDGITKISELPGAIKDMGMPAVAMTDHGSLAGALKFSNVCRDVGIKPIIGIEAYFAENRALREKDELEQSYYHLVLLAKNEVGLRNLFRMNSLAWETGFYKKGRIDDTLLEQYNEGVIGTSACLGGRIAQLLRRGSRKAAEAKILYYKDLFGGDFFLEIQDHDIPEQRELNKFLLEISAKYGIPPILTGDCHYLNRSDGVDKYSPHELLLGVQTGKTVDDPKKFSFDEREHWIKSPAELELVMDKNPEFPRDVLTNTLAIADMCTGEYFETIRGNHMPEVKDFSPWPKWLKKDTSKILEYQAKWGLVKRFDSDPAAVPQEYKDRLAHELSVITDLNYADYFLIVQDFTDWAREHKVAVGPGRGSVAGSLVAWALRLTDKATDPLANGLYFERFLNKSRVSPPDVDSDFQKSRRVEVIEYVRNKYGVENVAAIGTHGCFYPRSATRDMARVYGHDQSFINKLAKMIPDNFRGIPPTVEECEEQVPALTKPPYKEIWDKAKRIVGLPRNASSHAAGLIITTDEPLRNFIPMYRRSKSTMVVGKDAAPMMISELEMDEMEDMGFFKFDFLGLKNLDVRQKTADYILARHGREIDFDDIDYTDSKVFDLICDGKLAGIFQLENSLRSIIIRSQPRAVDEVSIVSALGRPGPIGAGLVDQYINNKRAGSYELPYSESIRKVLRPILEDTMGVMVYQEQVMRIAVELCGFSLVESDNLRKAIGKKKREMMEKMKFQFVSGATDNGHNKKEIEDLWGYKDEETGKSSGIVGFADYCFNKAHSFAYSVLSYQEAWLKTYYPAEFMAALMTCEEDMTKISVYVHEAKSLGVKVLAPSINNSKKGFTFQGNGLVFGLDSIKGLGATTVNALVRARLKRSFVDFEDFYGRIDSQKVNRAAVEKLIITGAFDEMNYRRDDLLNGLEAHSKYFQDLVKYHLKLSECATRRTDFVVAQSELEAIEALLGEIPMKRKDKVTKDPGHQERFDTLRKEKMLLRRVRLLKEPIKPELVPIEKYDGPQKITLELIDKEKEALGYYVSLHPTDFLTHDSRTSHINEISPGSTGVCNGVVMSVKEIFDKNKRKMAFILIEDATGRAEITVFSSQYHKWDGRLPPGTIVRLMYRADKGGETPVKLVVEKMRLISIDD